MRIRISNTIAIEEREISFDFVRASGPGGQNVNKVATAVQLRFDVVGASGLPPEVRARLIRLAGKRVTEDGVLVIEARRFRTQERNRQDAVNRLIHWIQKAAEKPKQRIKTSPSRAARERTLAAKKRRSRVKKTRRAVASLKDEG